MVALLAVARSPLGDLMALAMLASDVTCFGLPGESLIRTNSYRGSGGLDTHTIGLPDWTGAATPDPVTY